jgi:hypothetical protein
LHRPRRTRIFYSNTFTQFPKTHSTNRSSQIQHQIPARIAVAVPKCFSLLIPHALHDFDNSIFAAQTQHLNRGQPGRNLGAANIATIGTLRITPQCPVLWILKGCAKSQRLPFRCARVKINNQYLRPQPG